MVAQNLFVFMSNFCGFPFYFQWWRLRTTNNIRLFRIKQNSLVHSRIYVCLWLVSRYPTGISILMDYGNWCCLRCTLYTSVGIKCLLNIFPRKLSNKMCHSYFSATINQFICKNEHTTTEKKVMNRLCCIKSLQHYDMWWGLPINQNAVIKLR